MNLNQRLRIYLGKLFNPLMINPVVDNNGSIIAKTRMSNTTAIDGRENLTLGKNVFIGHFNKMDATAGLTIGEGCQLTNYISIITHSSHVAIRLYGQEYTKTLNPKAYFKDSVSIGSYTFIGPHSVIMPGAEIGKGCLVSAYSYVKGQFDDFSIISGNPAKKVGDTRDLDKSYLESYPELKPHYLQWANELPK